MEIRLTSGQLDALYRIFGQEQRYSDWLSKSVQRSQRRVDVVMPAIAWWKVREELIRRCFNSRGQRSSRVPPVEGTMLKRVVRALVEMHLHPALKRQGLPGHSGLVIPAWDRGAGEAYSEFPGRGTFVLLAPKWGTYMDMPVTQWLPAPPSELGMLGPLFDKDSHYAFGVIDDSQRAIW